MTQICFISTFSCFSGVFSSGNPVVSCKVTVPRRQSYHNLPVWLFPLRGSGRWSGLPASLDNTNQYKMDDSHPFDVISVTCEIA
jgi:hypothetical protein